MSTESPTRDESLGHRAGPSGQPTPPDGDDRPAAEPCPGLTTARVPEDFRPVFLRAEQYVREYFRSARTLPEQARVEFSGQRYILVRAASMSVEFFDLVSSLYADRGPAEAGRVAGAFLFDIAHALGKADARAFHAQMGVSEPLEKLSAGPLHFAHTGWAFVDILPASRPTTGEDYYLVYDHPYSFESSAWRESGRSPDHPVCFMNAGYSSGWCSESFGLPLVAVEVECIARGDDRCRFIMAPPSRIEEHVRAYGGSLRDGPARREPYLVPEFFQRKRTEEELERRVRERTAEVERRNQELTRANAELERLHRSKDEFVAMISHELRTPLVTGLGYIEMFLDGQLGPAAPAATDAFKVARRNLYALASLIDDILCYTSLARRFESRPPSLQRVDACALLRSCCEEFLVRSGRGRDSVAIEVPSAPVGVLAEEEMIRRVVSNLLDNAGRHAGPQARVQVGLRPEAGGKVRIWVRDDGPGVAPDVKEDVFEAFAKSRRSRGGAGLGLAIVREILTAHGTEPRLVSAPGEGTEVSFLLADASAKAAGGEPAEDEGRQPPRAEHAGRVLVVDDDRDTLALMRTALGARGFEVVCETDAEAGLKRIGTDRPDLVLLDMSLPGMDGAEACSRIKRDPRTADIPVIMFTAHAESQARDRARGAGCDGYMVKPVRMDALAAAVTEAIARRK